MYCINYYNSTTLTCNYTYVAISINLINKHLYTLLIPNTPRLNFTIYAKEQPINITQFDLKVNTGWILSFHIITVVTPGNQLPLPGSTFFNTLLLTKGVEEVGNLLDASSDDLYVLSIGPILLDWSLVALNMTLVMRMVRHCCWHITELRRHAYFHWITLFLLSNQGTVYYWPLKDPLPEG